MLTRFDPFNDPFFSDAFFKGLALPRQLMRDEEQTMTPPVEVHDSEQQLVLHAELPGFKQEEIELELEDHVLTLRATRERKETTEEQGRVMTERRYGTFTRSFKLPVTVDEDAVEATMEDGVLTVSFPKRAEARTKKITVGGHKPALEAAA
jgi:HSP20 family protein